MGKGGVLVRELNRKRSAFACYQAVCKNSSRRAGARGGARVGKPRWARILTITVGSSMAAMSVKGPPHCGQCAMSISNTRLSNWAQLSWARPSLSLDLGKDGFDVVLDDLVQRGLFGTPPVDVLLQDLTVCRHRRCVSRVKVPRKELFVHLSSTGKQRLNHQGLKFPMGKAAGRSASEPRRSLVT